MPEVYLGLDFGLKRIGVAVGQSITRTASPLTRIDAQAGIPNWSALDKLIKEWKPSALIIGLPLNMDDTEQYLTQCARKFQQSLQQRYALPVYEVDERLTTLEAKSRLYKSGKHAAIHKRGIDSVAAQIILETWFASS